MREILFRGKRVDGLGWVTDSETYIRDACGVWLSDEDNDVVRVVPETVGQFTGLTDKNGKRIFEGDVLSGHGEGNSIVAWDYENARFIGCEDSPHLWWRCSADEFGHYEVMGNIHDNPELMEGGLSNDRQMKKPCNYDENGSENSVLSNDRQIREVTNG